MQILKESIETFNIPYLERYTMERKIEISLLKRKIPT